MWFELWWCVNGVLTCWEDWLLRGPVVLVLMGYVFIFCYVLILAVLEARKINEFAKLMVDFLVEIARVGCNLDISFIVG